MRHTWFTKGRGSRPLQALPWRWLHPRSPLSRRERQIHCTLLSLLAAPLAIALSVRLGLALGLPPCPLRYLTGIPCPTCGMTRSVLAFTQGHWHQALHYHAFGPILLLLLVLLSLHLSLELGYSQHLQTFYIRMLRDRRVQIGGLIAYFGYYSLRLYHLSSSGQLAIAMLQSPLGELLPSYPHP